MPPLRLDQWAVRSPEPVSAQTGEGLALLSTEQKRYFVLNDSAAAVWERLVRPVELAALSRGIAADFDLPPQEAEDAVLEVVAHLLEQHIVLVGDAALTGGDHHER